MHKTWGSQGKSWSAPLELLACNLLTAATRQVRALPLLIHFVRQLLNLGKQCLQPSHTLTRLTQYVQSLVAYRHSSTLDHDIAQQDDFI